MSGLLFGKRRQSFDGLLELPKMDLAHAAIKSNRVMQTRGLTLIQQTREPRLRIGKPAGFVIKDPEVISGSTTIGNRRLHDGL